MSADATAQDAGTTRRLLALSASAFVVLAAEPLYLLVDTAVVGHLGSVAAGRSRRRSRGDGAADLVGTFVEYGTTARAARWFGAGTGRRRVNEGVQASWLAVAASASPWSAWVRCSPDR